MKKEMEQVEVFANGNDAISIAQGDEYLETRQIVCISAVQAEIVASWILDAAKELEDDA